MRQKTDTKWQDYVLGLSPERQQVIMLEAVGRLVQLDEVHFREAEPPVDADDPWEIQEALYWESCGEDISSL